MNENFICNICGSKHTDLTSYMKCVNSCYEKVKKEEKEAEAKKRAEEINVALNGIKQAKAYYEQKLNEFKEKYPAEYEMNFGSNDKSCSCGGNCKCEEDPLKVENKMKDIAISYENNGKDEPKFSARVNGKKVDDAHVKTLLDDPEVDWIAKMLGLV